MINIRNIAWSSTLILSSLGLSSFHIKAEPTNSSTAIKQDTEKEDNNSNKLIIKIVSRAHELKLITDEEKESLIKDFDNFKNQYKYKKDVLSLSAHYLYLNLFSTIIKNKYQGDNELYQLLISDYKARKQNIHGRDFYQHTELITLRYYELLLEKIASGNISSGDIKHPSPDPLITTIDPEIKWKTIVYARRLKSHFEDYLKNP